MLLLIIGSLFSSIFKAKDIQLLSAISINHQPSFSHQLLSSLRYQDNSISS
jgi:hypothetical protein